MKMKVSSRMIFLTLSLLSLISSQEASISQPIQSNYEDQIAQEPLLPSLPYTPSGGAKSQQIEPQVASKFIILTTGDQIKLYPLASDSDDQLGLSQNFWYSVKPIESDLTPEKREILTKLDNKIYTRWLFAKAAAEADAGNKAKRKKSILPDSQGDDEYHNSGWLKPKITDVDYFFNMEFCLHDQYVRLADGETNSRLISDNDCLVIVWLDNNNSYVRYGSLDLTKNLIELQTESNRKSHQDRVLWLNEFPPIYLHKESFVRNLAYSDHYIHLKHQAYAMAIDKRRSRLHVAFGDKTTYAADWILSGNIKPIYTVEQVEEGKYQLENETLLPFNECHKTADVDLRHTSIEALSVDETSGNWLFYFDKYQGGRIFGLNVEKQQQCPSYFRVGDVISTNSTRDETLPLSTIPQALVIDIPLGEWRNQRDQDKPIPLTNDAIGVAMDSESRRFFWLNKAHEVYSCDYTGDDVTLIGKLSLKPVIRSTYSMRIFQDILYISDPIKKSLIAYKLDNPQRSTGSNEMQSETNFATTKVQLQQTTHQVLLVEMPTLYGFRFVHTEKSPVPNAPTTHTVLSVSESGYIRLDKISEESAEQQENEEEEDNLNELNLYEAEGTQSDGIKHYPIRTEVNVIYEIEAKYSELLDRAKSSSNCGYERYSPQAVIARRSSHYQSAKLSYLAIHLGIILLALLICLSLLQVKKLTAAKKSLLSHKEDSAEYGDLA